MTTLTFRVSRIGLVAVLGLAGTLLVHAQTDNSRTTGKVEKSAQDSAKQQQATNSAIITLSMRLTSAEDVHAQLEPPFSAHKLVLHATLETLTTARNTIVSVQAATKDIDVSLLEPTNRQQVAELNNKAATLLKKIDATLLLCVLKQPSDSADLQAAKIANIVVALDKLKEVKAIRPLLAIASSTEQGLLVRSTALSFIGELVAASTDATLRQEVILTLGTVAKQGDVDVVLRTGALQAMGQIAQFPVKPSVTETPAPKLAKSYDKKTVLSVTETETVGPISNTPPMTMPMATPMADTPMKPKLNPESEKKKDS